MKPDRNAAMNFLTALALLPIPAAYVLHMNAGEYEAFAALFAPDAVVHDEGKQHHGPEAIQAWIEKAHHKYEPMFAPTGYREEDGGAVCVITGMVCGNFDGSPLELHHRLTIAEGKITGLKIMA
ncbi:MAG TPA: nuclear transport factor 2 family protein [Candidatus Saccharimonadia bacterium]|nr:nuclear transport factor 2 family protein [Candidatus Saccharimonadia bacterium]